MKEPSLYEAEAAREGEQCRLEAPPRQKKAGRKYRPRPGDRAFGPCNRAACEQSKGYTWEKRWVKEVLHSCPVPGKQGEVELRTLKPGPTFEEWSK